MAQFIGTDGGGHRFAVCRHGLAAGRFLARHEAGRVAVVFARGCYLTAGEDWLCLGGRETGGPEVGNGPLMGLCATPPDWSWRGAGLAPGDRFQITRAAAPTLAIGHALTLTDRKSVV